jgi:serine/threonine-protein kinase
LYTLKFLSLASPDWAWRELEVRLRLRRVGELAVESAGQWPHEAPRYLYLVTPYVRGRPVSDWARWKNPTAREVTRLLREVARQLAAVHAAGVVHRDVKSTNVLVRHGDGGPVLVDFGVSTYVGAPEITGGLPGTRHYHSPEALRFRRECAGEHSPARASDDLWALGVVLYWLLTGAYPFDTQVQDAGVLANLILKHEPEPPHVCNPRVPRALSELCLRMLEKRPEARYPDAEAVGSALEAVLAEADPAWDVALCEAWGPDAATTPQEDRLALADWRDKSWRLFAYARRHPRRGLPVPLEEASSLPRPPEEAPPGERQAPVDESPAPPPRARLARWRVLGSLLLALGIVGLLVLGRLLTPQVVSHPTISEVTKSGQEVASPVKPPEGERGAAPSRASTPAPVATATPRKDGKRMRTPKQASTSRQEEQRRTRGPVLDTAGKACVLVWVAGQFACASPEAQVRPTAGPAPSSVPCPAGSEETMKAMGLAIGARQVAVFFIDGQPIISKYITVRPGQRFSLFINKAFGEFPEPTLYNGELVFGEGRIYGRVTEAQTPDGQTYRVCFRIYGNATKPEENGLPMEPGSRPGAARIFSTVWMYAVQRFEE